MRVRVTAGARFIQIGRLPVVVSSAVGSLANLKLAMRWFPAHCKTIIARAVEGGFLIIVDPAYPNAWRREPYYGQLLALAHRSLVKIRVGRRFIGLNADGSEEQVTRTQPGIEGRADH